MRAQADAVEHIEVNLLLEGIFQRYGYDFRLYARSSVDRRLAAFKERSELTSYSDVTAKMLRDPEFFLDLLGAFSVSVTSLFRDPGFYRALREEVMPLLRTWPNVKIWDAGCATGEEPYSVAITADEAGLLARTRIYATDLCRSALNTGKTGIYSLEVLKQGSTNYQAAGGLRSLSDSFHAKGNAGVMSTALRKSVTFAQHNLALDQSFGEMHLIVCRNVLIYFSPELQNKVLELFLESLTHGGFLCLGTSETLSFTSVAEAFVAVNSEQRIYKKRVTA